MAVDHTLHDGGIKSVAGGGGGIDAVGVCVAGITEFLDDKRLADAHCHLLVQTDVLLGAMYGFGDVGVGVGASRPSPVHGPDVNGEIVNGRMGM